MIPSANYDLILLFFFFLLFFFLPPSRLLCDFLFPFTRCSGSTECSTTGRRAFLIVNVTPWLISGLLLCSYALCANSTVRKPRAFCGLCHDFTHWRRRKRRRGFSHSYFFFFFFDGTKYFSALLTFYCSIYSPFPTLLHVCMSLQHAACFRTL